MARAPSRHPLGPLALSLLLLAPVGGCSGSTAKTTSNASPSPSPSAPTSAPPSAPPTASPGLPANPLTGTVRIGYLHHSTGANVWAGGVEAAIQAWNGAHATDYRITEVTYPDTGGGYPWANYPYDYWDLWVAYQGTSRDQGELNLDDLVQAYDVIVFKHCFPVSDVVADDGAPSVSSPSRTTANYQLQYAALKARLREFPAKRFVLWTGAALTEQETDPASATRARDFFAWVKGTWDEPGDNVYLWDFHALETDGGLYLVPAHATGPNDPHPNASFSQEVAPLVARRIIDVIEGRGDSGSLTGQ